MITETWPLDHYTVSDRRSGCRVFIQRCVDGRIAVKFDDEPAVFKTEQELRDETRLPWGKDDRIPYELLRRHLESAHVDESYVELAAR